MTAPLIIKNPQVFTGYNHLGTCREFVWEATQPMDGRPVPSRFKIRGLRCDYDLEGLMVRRDLFLHTPEGQEYVVANFQIIDVTNREEIRGVATACRLLMEEFPAVKTLSRDQPVVISKDSHLQAFRAISGIISNVHTKQTIDARTANAVVNELAGEIIKAPGAVLNLLSIKSFDDYTFSHNINVATLAMTIGHSMGLSPDQLRSLGVGALLHDLGKLRVPQRLLNKEGRLDHNEFAEVARHPVLGSDLVRNSKEIGEPALEVILHHHEKFQGAGYPHGQSGAQISILARICAIADVFDALTTDRPFRPAMMPSSAMRILVAQTGTHFDPEILRFFVRKVSLYPPGSLVELDDGSRAVVIRANPNHLLRPVVKLVAFRPGQNPIIDLRDAPRRYIRKALK